MIKHVIGLGGQKVKMTRLLSSKLSGQKQVPIISKMPRLPVTACFRIENGERAECRRGLRAFSGASVGLGAQRCS